MRTPDALGDLVACLRGEVPDRVDWAAVLELANRSLVSPVLAHSLRDAERVPDDVRVFLAAVEGRNRERNRRLYAQLSEAVARLADAGIPAILLKGTVVLATGTEAVRSGRVLSDIDLLVRPDDLDRAMDHLTGAGYALHRAPAAGDAPAVLARPCDVGMIDLHPVVKGGKVRLDFDWFARGAAWHEVGGAPVMVPSGTGQAMHLFVHDQLKGHDHVRGLIDLRHLVDLHRLSAEPGGIDWQALAEALPDRRTRNALACHLLTARRLLGLELPEVVRAGAPSRFQYGRRMLQARLPRLTGLLTILTLLLDPANLASSGARRLGRAATEARSRGWPSAARAVCGDARRLLRGRILGKV